MGMATVENNTVQTAETAVSSDLAVAVRNAVKDYTVGTAVVHALRGISLDIRSGEFIAVMGPSGSGKSTLMHLVGCLDTPSDGKIFIHGEDTSLLDQEALAALRNRTVGFVFQQFNLLARLSILDNVITPMIYGQVPLSERRRRGREALESVGLADRLTHRPSELSGGQQQRAAVARAMIMQPKIILADEPTGALDTDTGKAIMELFMAINRQGCTVILVTHEPDIAAYAQRTIRLKDGLQVD
jgi:putative ABC transport system ATP-binding protein